MYVGGNWLPESWPCPDFKSSIVDLREDLTGNLWIATCHKGLFQLSPANGWVHLGLECGLPTLSNSPMDRHHRASCRKSQRKFLAFSRKSFTFSSSGEI